jgi:hypothetical protein
MPPTTAASTPDRRLYYSQEHPSRSHDDRWIWDFWHLQDRWTHHLYYLQAPESLGGPELRHGNATIGHATS